MAAGALPGPWHRHVPCLLDEADDKFAHFNRLIYLEGDDLLPGQKAAGQDLARPTRSPRTHTPLPSATHVQEVVQQRGIFVDDQFLDLEGEWGWEEERTGKARPHRCRQQRAGDRSSPQTRSAQTLALPPLPTMACKELL